MKTAGQILQASCTAKKLEVEDVARITKIRPQFLKFLEVDDYTRLPNATVARGFIRNYCEFLGLNPEHLLAVFRRDFDENQQGQIVPRVGTQPVKPASLWTPRTTVIATMTLIFALFGAYLFYQYRLLTGPPSLEISSPTGTLSVNQSTLEVIGKTDPEATISVNGQLVALDKGGSFSLRIPLELGSNEIVVTAIAKSGRKSTISKTVNRVDNSAPSR